MNANHPRERLVNTAARLVHQQGWTATGINQILSEANIPKGSFYYYFRSKEALGAAVLQLHAAQIKQLVDKTLLNPQLSAKIALDSFVTDLVQLAETTAFRLGCPAGSLANEIATQSQLLLAEANRALSLYEDGLIAVIQRGQKEGAITPSIDPVDFGKIVAMLVQGAFLSMKCSSSAAPMQLARSAARVMLFGETLSGKETESLPKLHALAS